MSTSTLGGTRFVSLSYYCMKLTKETKKAKKTFKKGKRLTTILKVVIKAQQLRHLFVVSTYQLCYYPSTQQEALH